MEESIQIHYEDDIITRLCRTALYYVRFGNGPYDGNIDGMILTVRMCVSSDNGDVKLPYCTLHTFENL